MPVVASITNFSGAQHHQYRVGLPHAGRWNEILNTDAESYGGSGIGNLGSVVAEEVPWHGQPCSALVTLPALGAVWLEPAERVVPASTGASGAARAVGTSGRTGSTAMAGGTSLSEGPTVAGSSSGGTSASEGHAMTEGVVPAAGSEADASTPPTPSTRSTSGTGDAGAAPQRTTEKE